MDPNETLRAMLDYAAEVLHAYDSVDDAAEVHADGNAYLCAQAVVDLDEWLTRGGFLPTRWTHAYRRKVAE